MFSNRTIRRRLSCRDAGRRLRTRSPGAGRRGRRGPRCGRRGIRGTEARGVRGDRARGRSHDPRLRVGALDAVQAARPLDVVGRRALRRSGGQPVLAQEGQRHRGGWCPVARRGRGHPARPRRHPLGREPAGEVDARDPCVRRRLLRAASTAQRVGSRERWSSGRGTSSTRGACSRRQRRGAAPDLVIRVVGNAKSSYGIVDSEAP